MIKWLAIFLLISACAPRVVHFTNESSNFRKYETFDLVNLKVSRLDLSPEGEKLISDIEKAIFSEMTRREYRYASTNPTLLIRYEIISNQETDVSYNNSPIGSAFYGPSITIRTFLQSALLLEIIDASTKKLVWQASVDLKNYDNIKDQEELIEKAVNQMYDTYLRRAKSIQIDETLKTGK